VCHFLHSQTLLFIQETHNSTHPALCWLKSLETQLMTLPSTQNSFSVSQLLLTQLKMYKNGLHVPLYHSPVPKRSLEVRILAHERQRKRLGCASSLSRYNPRRSMRTTCLLNFSSNQNEHSAMSDVSCVDLGLRMPPQYAIHA
jgi:hypothetical protein